MRISRTRRLDDRSAEALLSGRAVAGEPELAAFVARARALPLEPPTPSPALAAMLEGGVPPAVLDRTPVVLPAPARRAVSWRYALAGATAGVMAVVGAGAANALPAPAQRAVADVVGWVTPFDLPRPAPAHDLPTVVPAGSPTPAPDAQPSEAARPEPARTASAEPSESPSGDGEHSGSDARETPEPTSSTERSGTEGTTGGTTDGGTETTTSPEPQPSASESPSSDSGTSGSSDTSSSLGSATEGTSATDG